MSAPANNRSPVRLPNQPASAERIGQGTAIEQSRAAAEVYASVLSAKNSPRDQQMARRLMRDACGMKALAEQAFFRFNRGGSQVSGPTVHLARELARCWGNIQYGVQELRRDDEAGQSEMQAFAWEMETNARASSIFIVPHKRDKKGGPEALNDMRDIYENNANNGARRVREAIFSVLPMWYVEEAKELCVETLKGDGSVPLQQRISKAIEKFTVDLRVTEQQLVEKLGRPASAWTELDLANLTVIIRSIQNGETTVADEFEPAAQVTTAELTRGRRQNTDKAPAAPAEPAPKAEGTDPADDAAPAQTQQETSGDALWPDVSKPGAKGGKQ